MSTGELLMKGILSSNNIASLTESSLHNELAVYLNHLILNNFNDLIQLLYRVDISESTLKTLLKENRDTNAGKMIASLIIERQIQKIKSRLEHQRDNDIDEEEKW